MSVLRPPPCMYACAMTPSLIMVGSSSLFALINLFCAGLPCPSCPVPPYHWTNQCLTSRMPPHSSHIPLPRSDAITFSSGICSTHINGEVALHIMFSVDNTHEKGWRADTCYHLKWNTGGPISLIGWFSNFWILAIIHDVCYF